MALVTAKCTECGAAIEVEDTKDAGICNFCGTAFVTQKVINEHHTHVTKNITKNVFGVDGKSAEDFCVNGEIFLKLKDWDKAKSAFEQATIMEPANYLGWFGLVKAWTENFTYLGDNTHKEFLEKALAVSNEESKKIIDDATMTYLKLEAEVVVKIDELKAKHDKMYPHNWVLYGFIPFLGIFLGAIGSIAGGVMLGVYSNLAVGLPLLIVGILAIASGIITTVVYFKKRNKANTFLEEIHTLSETRIENC